MRSTKILGTGQFSLAIKIEKILYSYCTELFTTIMEKNSYNIKNYNEILEKENIIIDDEIKQIANKDEVCYEIQIAEEYAKNCKSIINKNTLKAIAKEKNKERFGTRLKIY